MGIAFDDDRLVDHAGLLLPATLAGRLGLGELADAHLDLGDAAGRANAGDKLLTLVASALAGGDCIDDARCVALRRRRATYTLKSDVTAAKCSANTTCATFSSLLIDSCSSRVTSPRNTNSASGTPSTDHCSSKGSDSPCGNAKASKSTTTNPIPAAATRPATQVRVNTGMPATLPDAGRLAILLALLQDREGHRLGARVMHA